MRSSRSRCGLEQFPITAIGKFHFFPIPVLGKSLRTGEGVCIEPDLQPVFEDMNGATANSQPGARLDIAANGVWGGNHERTYFDVRVFNPYAPSNKH